jgi:hypothetical protein
MAKMMLRALQQEIWINNQSVKRKDRPEAGLPIKSTNIKIDAGFNA